MWHSARKLGNTRPAGYVQPAYAGPAGEAQAKSAETNTGAQPVFCISLDAEEFRTPLIKPGSFSSAD